MTDHEPHCGGVDRFAEFFDNKRIVRHPLREKNEKNTFFSFWFMFSSRFEVFIAVQRAMFFHIDKYKCI